MDGSSETIPGPSGLLGRLRPRGGQGEPEVTWAKHAPDPGVQAWASGAPENAQQFLASSLAERQCETLGARTQEGQSDQQTHPLRPPGWGRVYFFDSFRPCLMPEALPGPPGSCRRAGSLGPRLGIPKVSQALPSQRPWPCGRGMGCPPFKGTGRKVELDPGSDLGWAQYPSLSSSVKWA